MKVLWIGAGLGPKTKQQVLEHNGKLLSSYVSQTNLVEGLDAWQIDMDSLNAMNVDESVLRVIDTEKWSRNGTSQDVSVGYRNIKYLNRIYKQKALCREAKRWAMQHRQQKNVAVLVYGMHMPFIAAARTVKRIIPHARICLIVPDLPQFMDLSMSRLKKMLKRLDWIRIQKGMRAVDRYVLYAQPMAEFLRLRNDQWIVMEGSYDSQQLADEDIVPVKEKKVIMYSGVLDLRYGIPELLDAMELLGDDYLLWLTGDGNAVDLIKEKAKSDPRVVFYGYLPSRQDLLNKQAEATILINPRRDEEEGSQYCFPSKLFEYMVSGRPVISCFLKGIPEEYHDHLYELACVSAEEIAKTVKMVTALDASARDDKGEKAKHFVLKEKNKYVQAQKIAEFAGLFQSGDLTEKG